MGVPSEIIGIHQGDMIVRTGIMAAIADLRANDWLLDYVFNSLAEDDLTKAEYGRKEIEAAKAWFRRTKINVMMSTAIVDPKFPVITITQLEGAEAELTLSDTHYVPQQDDGRLWPALTPEFGADYNMVTGVVTLPELDLVIAPGQQLVDWAGKAHEILEVIDDRTVKITPGVADFTKTVIKGRAPAQITRIGSAKHKENYAIGCHVQGEQTHLMYLHSLLVFCLYRYKKRLFEARGFERHGISSSDFRRNEAFENELTFSRHLTLTGYVPQVWPEETDDKITSTTTVPVVEGAGKQEDPEDQSWVSEEDALTVGLKLT